MTTLNIADHKDTPSNLTEVELSCKERFVKMSNLQSANPTQQKAALLYKELTERGLKYKCSPHISDVYILKNWKAFRILL